ncbi:Crp/Fnr family transcriptional regulator [Defluviimonas salinarum]|uniref:Crp/Fnr family transcriptional regulator n=1 Tax=Defluviimonas salinarum TaxID=2992147 RepID=A0ABT3J4N2_9RHOB|nr:Crp/Fnr family transcriptional regulator [Defluviimonas salinarum]MCW3782625.1 Crp/Fnr family transcriptional regulator [Defluviimonas salinarum]
MRDRDRIADHDSEILRSVPIFCDLDEPVLAEIARHVHRRSWVAGEAVFSKGDEGSYMLIVADGRIRLSIVSAAGRELLIRIASPGDLVGEIACLDGGVRTADATAVSAVQALVLSRRNYRDIASRFPELNVAVIQYLCNIVRDTDDRLEGLALHNLKARLARFILFAVRELNGSDADPTAHLSIDLTQGELSQFLGASRPKINRVLHDFHEDRVLVREERTWTCDLGALRSLAESDE